MKILKAVSLILVWGVAATAQAEPPAAGFDASAAEAFSQAARANAVFARRRAERQKAEAVREAREAEDRCAPRGGEPDEQEARTFGIVFPNLGKTTYYVMAPATREYNCIAWSALKEDSWDWPGDSTEAFDAYYGELGYEPVEDFETAVIALFVDKDGRPTHAARREPRGGWSSKCGGLAKVTHETLEDVETPETANGDVGYGTAVRYYAPKDRRKEGR